MEYDTSGIDEMEADAFNADAFKSITKLVFTKMNLRWLTKGLFNGLDSLEVLKIKDVSRIQSVYLGILDGVNKTLKEFTLESNSSYEWHHDNVEDKQKRIFDSNLDPLRWYLDNEKLDEMTASHIDVTTTTPDPLKWYHDREKNKRKRAYQSVEAPIPLDIDAFTGSEETLSVEYVKVRYYLFTLTSKSFVALKNIKHLDLSNCGIESILQGTFDPILITIEVLRLMNNPFKQLPAGMFDIIPPSINTYIFLGDDVDECECDNLPINFIVKVECTQPSEADKIKDCFSLLPNNLITTSEPTIGSTSDDTTDLTTLKRATTVSPTIERATFNLLSTTKPTIASVSPTTEELTIASVTVGENIVSSMLFGTEPTLETEAQPYSQSSSKYKYYIISVVTLLLCLLVFIVWFNFRRQRRFTFLSQYDSI